MVNKNENWHATHRITFVSQQGATQVWDVMLTDEGPAYTSDEWEVCGPASWGVSDGHWSCEGQVTPGGCCGSITVETLSIEGGWTYTIFDADPNTVGGCAWPSHDSVEFEGTLEEVFEEATSEAQNNGEKGETLWVIIWDEDCQIQKDFSLIVEST